jgi:hypothetical protein
MMQDIHGKLNPGLPWQKQPSIQRILLLSQIGLKLKEETNEVLYLEHRILWC